MAHLVAKSEVVATQTAIVFGFELRLGSDRDGGFGITVNSKVPKFLTCIPFLGLISFGIMSHTLNRKLNEAEGVDRKIEVIQLKKSYASCLKVSASITLAYLVAEIAAGVLVGAAASATLPLFLAISMVGVVGWAIHSKKEDDKEIEKLQSGRAPAGPAPAPAPSLSLQPEGQTSQ